MKGENNFNIEKQLKPNKNNTINSALLIIESILLLIAIAIGYNTLINRTAQKSNKDVQKIIKKECPIDQTENEKK